MGAAWIVAVCQLRARWRWHVVLGAAVAMVGAVVLVTAAGARRTDSAYSRLRASTEAADASVEVSPEYFGAIERLPEVEALAPASFLFVTPIGSEVDDLQTVAGTDERFANAFDRPRLAAGRRPAPDRVDEVLLNPRLAADLEVGPGDRIPLASFAPDQVERLVAGEDPGEPAGPEMTVTVVGVGQPAAEGLVAANGLVLLTPAFYATHRGDIGHFDDILSVRLRNGSRDVAAFEAGVRRIVPASEEPIVDAEGERSAEIEDATGVQAMSLWLFALVVLLAGIVAVGQAFAREMSLYGPIQATLAGLGLGRRERAVVLLTPPVLVVVAGMAVAVGLAIATSPMMPIGIARRAEPHPGVAVDGLVLGCGFAAVVAAMVGRAAFSAWVNAAPAVAGGREAPGRAGRAVDRLARAGIDAPVAIGVRMALEPGAGPSAVPVRSAVVGSVLGVAGLLAALTFNAGLTDLVTDPASYGWRWDVSVATGAGGTRTGPDPTGLAEDEDIAGVSALTVRQLLVEAVPLQSYGLDPIEGDGYLTVLEGREPAGRYEALVGTETLERVDREVGDRVELEAIGGGSSRSFTIVGRGVFPEFAHPAVPDSDVGAYDDFALVSAADLETFGAADEDFQVALVRWSGQADAPTAERTLSAGGAEVGRPELPQNLKNVEHVRAFPGVIAALLALLAVLGVTHLVSTTTRRRAQTLIVLRAIGLVRRQLNAVIRWQATTVTVVGLLVGIPVGVIVGRLAWGVVATNLKVGAVVPTPTLAILIVVIASIALAGLIATVAATVAARRPAAPAHRSE